MNKITTAIILAGGRGDRLKPHTIDRPKPGVLIKGRPIVAYQIEELKKTGVDTVYFSVKYQAKSFMSIMGDGSKYAMKFYYDIQKRQMHRGGAIKHILKKIKTNEENFIITNGDDLWRFNLQNAIKQHLAKNATLTLVVNRLRSPFGVVTLNNFNNIVNFKEKPSLPFWRNAGVFIIHKSLVNYLPEEGDFEEVVIPQIPTKKTFAYKSNGYFRPIDTHKDLIEANNEVFSSD